MIFDNKKSETRKKVVEAEQINSFTKEASELFRDKPFAEANKVQFLAAKVVGIIAQIISVFLSVNFASGIFKDLLPTFLQNYYFITFLSIAILGIIEFAKRFTIKSIAVSYFKKSLSLFNVLLFFVLFGVSVYAAVVGAVEYTKEQTDKSKDIASDANDELKDVSSDYKRQIKEAQNDLKEFKKSVSWHGAINTSDQKTMSLIATKQARIAKLQDALERDKEDIRKNKDEEITKNSAKVETSSVRIFCFSLVVELVSLLCIGFIFYFLGTTHIDNFIDSNSNTTTVLVPTVTTIATPTVIVPTVQTVEKPSKTTPTVTPTVTTPTVSGFTGLPPCDNMQPAKRHIIGFASPTTAPTPTVKTNTGTCPNCQTDFEKTNPRKIYCSKSCGYQHWQTRKGITIFGEKI